MLTAISLCMHLHTSRLQIHNMNRIPFPLYSSYSAFVDEIPSISSCLSLLNRTPIDESTTKGYLEVLAYDLSSGLVFQGTTLTISALFLSMGLYLGTFCSHFESMLQQMVTENRSTAEKVTLMKMRLIDAINLHIQAKE